MCVVTNMNGSEIIPDKPERNRNTHTTNVGMDILFAGTFTRMEDAREKVRIYPKRNEELSNPHLP